jgi:ribose transport system permease protein
MTTMSDSSSTTLTGRRGPNRQSLLGFAERGGLLILLAAMIVFFSVDGATGDVFRSGANLRSILSNQSVTGLIALAMVVPLVAGYFDLSTAAVAGLANVTTAALIGTHGWPVAAGVVAAMAVAASVGVINGLLVAALKLNGFVVTLGMYTLIGGLLQFYTKGSAVTEGIPESFSDWGSLQYLGIPRPFWLLVVVGLVTWYALMHTPWGRQLASIGSNQRAAHLVGVRVDRIVFSSLVASALLAGAAGVLLTSRSGGADPVEGTSYLFPALAAVFLGATTIRPGSYNVWGTIAGVFVVAVGVSGFTLLGAAAWLTDVFNGGALILAVAVSTIAGQRRLKGATSHAAEIETGGPADTASPVRPTAGTTSS